MLADSGSAASAAPLGMNGLEDSSRAWMASGSGSGVRERTCNALRASILS